MSQVLGTISSALEARSLATPDAAVRTIPETIRLSLAAVGGDFTSRMPNVAVTSSVGSAARPSPDTWLAAFTNTASETSSACGEPIATDTSLDDPIRVLVSGTGMCSDGGENAQQAGSPNLPPSGGPNTTDTNHSSTTVLQYSAGRNPFRPSRDGASTDILQVEIQGGRRPCQEEQRRQRRRQLGRYDAAEYDTFNVSFEIRSRLWGNGSRNEVKSENMPIPIPADSSKDTCNASAVQNVSGVRTADDRQMACAWWSNKDGGNGAWRGDGCRLLNVKSSTVCTASSPYVVQTATCNCIFKVKRSDDSEEDLFATTVAIVEHVFTDIERGFLKSLLGENFVPDISAILLCALPLAAYILMVVKQVVCKKRCEHISSTRFCCRRCPRHRDEARALSRASASTASSVASVESKASMGTDDGGVVIDVTPVERSRIAGVPRASSANVDEADEVEKEEEEEEGETKDRGEQKNGKGAELRRTLSGRLPSMYSEDHTDVPAATATTSATAATAATGATTGELTNAGAPAASGAAVLRTRSSGGRTKLLHRQSKSVNPLLKAVFGFKGVEKGAVSHSFFWWYWMALKRNHDILAPWLAPPEPYKTTVHYSTVLFAKFAAIVAATTALFEMHVSFRVPNHPPPTRIPLTDVGASYPVDPAQPLCVFSHFLPQMLSIFAHALLTFASIRPPPLHVCACTCSLAQLCFKWKNLLHEAMNPILPTFNMGGDIGYSNSNSSNGSNSSAAGGGGSSMSTANYEYGVQLLTWRNDRAFYLGGYMLFCVVCWQ